MAIVYDPPQLPRTRRRSRRDWRGWRSRYRFYHQLEERFADDHLVARLDLDGAARGEARLTVHVGAVETADVLDRDLGAVDANQRMLARDLGFGIVGVEIDFGKRSGLGIPSADQVVAVLERKFLALASTANDRQLRLERRACGSRGWSRRRALGRGLRLDLTGRRFRLGHFGSRRFAVRLRLSRRRRRRVRVATFSRGCGGTCFRSRRGG